MARWYKTIEDSCKSSLQTVGNSKVAAATIAKAEKQVGHMF